MVATATLLMGAMVLAALEGTGVTNLRELVGWMKVPPAKTVEPDPEAQPAIPSKPKQPGPGATDRPVKVFIMAGDSNMAGRAKVSLLEYQSRQPETKKRFQHLLKNGKWIVREDVWFTNSERKGNLSVGFGQEPGLFGPELEFGISVGDHFDEQVLIIETAWGGYLFGEFRPPSSVLPSEEALQQILKNMGKRKRILDLDKLKKSYGIFYQRMLRDIAGTLENLGDHFPGYEGQGYEIAGFVWFQGWNDHLIPEFSAAYPENMANLIRDVRKDLKTPNLPFVIGQFGHFGVEEQDQTLYTQKIKLAQAAVAQLTEFQGSVSLVKTDLFWDAEAHTVFNNDWKNHLEEWQKVGSDFPFHLYGSARTFCGIGRAFGEGSIELYERRKNASPVKRSKHPTPTEILTSDKWKWTEPVKLGPKINTDADEGGPELSADGLTLLFHSNRPGSQPNVSGPNGVPSVDLWMSSRESTDDAFGEPVNLGPTINGKVFDRDPALSADALTLVFSSKPCWIWPGRPVDEYTLVPGRSLVR